MLVYFVLSGKVFFWSYCLRGKCSVLFIWGYWGVWIWRLIILGSRYCLFVNFIKFLFLCVEFILFVCELLCGDVILEIELDGDILISVFVNILICLYFGVWISVFKIEEIFCILLFYLDNLFLLINFRKYFLFLFDKVCSWVKID